ncbi:hypothetical protein Tco_0245899 [Tanacetum coccineum]
MLVSRRVLSCGDPLEDGVLVNGGTCKWCGSGPREGFCFCFAPSKRWDSSLNSESETLSMISLPTIFPPTSTTPVRIILVGIMWERYLHLVMILSATGAKLVYVAMNRGYDNYYPQNPPSFPQQYLNCEKCGGFHEDYQCQPWHQNFPELNLCYDSNSYSFDRPSQCPIDQSPPQEMSIQDIRYRRECEIKIDELKGKFNEISIEINKKKELRQLEQAANLSTYTTKTSRRFNSFYDDNDYEESIVPLNETISQIPPSIAITPVLLTIEPEDSIIMGDEDLSTIPKKESDEAKKSSV